jgi:hypothetical protein
LLLWGVMHVTYLAAESSIIVRSPSRPHHNQPYWRQFARTALVFLLVLLAWVPFRADLQATFVYWNGLLNPMNWYNALRNPSSIQLAIGGFKFAIEILGLIGMSIGLDLIHNHFGELAFHKLPIPLQALALNVIVFMLILAIMAQSVAPPFAYQGF